MNNLRNGLKYFLGLLVLLILGVWVYIQSHQPQLRGKKALDGIKSDVEVFYDDFGVPHIYASNQADAYLAFGYLHAQDRLFQIDLMRKVGQGRLSELFGPELSEADAFYRTIGTNRKALEDAKRFDSLPPRAQEICEAYIKGINTYIENGKLPLEYKILGVSPEKYTIEDMYAVAGYMAYSFAYALRTDPLVEKIYTDLGGNYLSDLGLAHFADTSSSDSIEDPKIMLPTARSGISAIDQLPVPMFQGSNSWALGPSRTLSSEVIFANDTHIKYSSPSVWYEAHIEYPGFGFYGNFLAGVPVAMIGHSRNHAFGITMFEEDDSDFFYEKFSSKDSSETVFMDSLTAPVKKFVETLHRKDAPDSTFTVYETVHGTIINEYLPVKFDEPISMYWNYRAIDNNLLEAFYRLNYASGIDEFEKGVRLVGAPGLNISYGDASGNIAVWSASKLLKRPDGNHGKSFLQGHSGDDEYMGFHDFDRNPKTVNPVEGMIISANQKHDTTEGISYPGYYAPSTRYDRIADRLPRIFPASVDSIKNLSLDVKSNTESTLCSEIVQVVLNSSAVLTDLEESSLEELRNWGGEHRLKDIAPTIYYQTLYTILNKTLSDELTKPHFEKLLNTHLIKKAYPDLMLNDNSQWWDNKLTEGRIESREDIIVESFRKAVIDLQEMKGNDTMEWKWGSVHTVNHPHPLGNVDVLKPFFDVGPFPAP
ncbi:MAG TPA: penicillin acylase family protein, partial [Cryomorphaceae bacterium]|nr:penicillin acylase family protein [Cryomorphaceae bacterium]